MPKNSEILFNKQGKNDIVKKNANDAKKIVQLLNEHAKDDKQLYRKITNLYSRKMNAAQDSINQKLEEGKMRPFEFLTILN